MGMTCSDVVEALDAFIDGELQSGGMREVARHLARCEPCEASSRRLESLQVSVRDVILSDVGDVDAQPAWDAIASELGDARPSWQRIRGELSTRLGGVGRFIRGERLGLRPIWLGGAAIATALALFVLWSGERDQPQQIARDPGSVGAASFQRQVATAGDAVMMAGRIDRLETPGSVRVWSQPDSGALVIWVDEEGLSVEQFLP